MRFSFRPRSITGFLEVGVWNRFVGFWVNAVGFSTALLLDFHQSSILQFPQGVDRLLPPAVEQLHYLVDGENSGEVFRTSIDGYQGSTFKQLLINENMNEEYVLQAINLHRKVLRESKVGSAIPHLNKKLFKAIEIPIPPYKEQQRIIKAITKAFMSLDLIMESL